MSQALALDLTAPHDLGGVSRLSDARPGQRGVITAVSGVAGALQVDELERRLLELGFVEGAAVEILHEGAIGRDPIAVKVDDMRVALRRHEAQGVEVRFS